jgi:hypothetical protein
MGILRSRAKKRNRSAKFWILVGSGVAAMYFLDPANGRARRAKFTDRFGAFFRRGARRAERTGRMVAAEAYGIKQRAVNLTTPDTIPPNDETLKAKIESEVLRGDSFPKGQINVDVVDGLVTIRGRLDRPEQIDDLEQQVRKITGVIDVHNLAHV